MIRVMGAKNYLRMGFVSKISFFENGGEVPKKKRKKTISTWDTWANIVFPLPLHLRDGKERSKNLFNVWNWTREKIGHRRVEKKKSLKQLVFHQPWTSGLQDQICFKSTHNEAIEFAQLIVSAFWKEENKRTTFICFISVLTHHKNKRPAYKIPVLILQILFKNWQMGSLIYIQRAC